jgi:Malic enzyme, N-terminal domain
LLLRTCPIMRLRSLSALCKLSSSEAAVSRCNSLRPFHSAAACSKHDDDEDQAGDMMIPWVRTVISGVGIMRHPKYNKGLAFTNQERDMLHLRGLLPPAVLDLETQKKRVMINIRTKASDLERYSYMQSLQERNEGLFYTVVRENIEELLPVVHLPTVRQACRKYGLMFKSLPRSLFITRQDMGNISQVLKNWPERRIKVVMITNGHHVGPAGDLGVHAVNATIAKLSLVTAIGGIAPMLCLPIQLDLGTDSEALLKSQFYSGLRHKRVGGDAAQELMHELLSAIERRFGRQTMIFFEDMAFRDTQRLLSQYRRAPTCGPSGKSATCRRACLSHKHATCASGIMHLSCSHALDSTNTASMHAGCASRASATPIMASRRPCLPRRLARCPRRACHCTSSACSSSATARRASR